THFGDITAANDGSLLLPNSQDSVGSFGNTVRIYRLFRDDAPVGQLIPRNLTSERHASLRFNIDWRDDDGLDIDTFSNDDVTVSFPNGTRRKAKMITLFLAGDHKHEVVTYQVTQPDGVWDASDNGEYTVRIERRSVRDINGNA